MSLLASKVTTQNSLHVIQQQQSTKYLGQKLCKYTNNISVIALS